MKSIDEIIQENQEEQIDESLNSFLHYTVEIGMLVAMIGLFVKSIKDIKNGESDIFEIAKMLYNDAKVNKICRKLAKDDDIKAILTGKENMKKDAFEEAVKSKLSEKDAKYFLDITREKVQEYIKK